MKTLRVLGISAALLAAPAFAASALACDGHGKDGKKSFTTECDGKDGKKSIAPCDGKDGKKSLSFVTECDGKDGKKSIAPCDGKDGKKS